jgi:hypothetical protein
MKRLSDLSLLLALLCSFAFVGQMAVLEAGCAKAPPSLSPAGQADFNKTRVVKALDLVRDTAVDAEAAHVISTDDTRQVVLWHKSAVSVVAGSETGWKGTVTTTLDQVVTHLKPEAQTKLGPYVALLKALIAEVN